jgi:hypothetical protein
MSIVNYDPCDNRVSGAFLPVFASRSKMRNRGAESNGNASRSCCTIYKLVGCRVTLQCKMRIELGAGMEPWSSQKLEDEKWRKR